MPIIPRNEVILTNPDGTVRDNQSLDPNNRNVDPRAGQQVNSGGVFDQLGQGLTGNRADNQFQNVSLSDFLAPGLSGLINNFTEQQNSTAITDGRLRNALNQNANQQQALAAGNRTNRALAQRTAAINTQQASVNAAGQAQVAGLQEQQFRRQQLLQALGLQQQGQTSFESARTQRFGALLGTPTPGENLLSLVVGGISAGFGGGG